MSDISVIIPVFNVEPYLAECLDSILEQKNVALEVICVEDASEDGSKDILKRYAKEDKRIRILENRKNRGLSYTRNRGLLSANGKYVLFVDSDDMLKENALQELFQYAQANNLEGIVFDMEYKIEGRFAKEKLENAGVVLNPAIPEKIRNGKELFICLSEYGNWKMEAWRYFWRKDFLIQNKLFFYNGLLHEDILFTFLCLMHTKRIANLNHKYYVYRKRDASITSQMNYKYVESHFIIFLEIFNYWKNHNFDKRTEAAIGQYAELAYGRFQRAKKYFAEFQQLSLGSMADQFLYEKIYERKQRKYASLEADKITRLKQAEKVILYGAGEIAAEVTELLEEHGVAISAVAVTDKRNNMKKLRGYPVYGMDELMEWKKNAIVVIAVTERYHNGILKHLECLGFLNVMFLDKKE